MSMYTLVAPAGVDGPGGRGDLVAPSSSGRIAREALSSRLSLSLADLADGNLIRVVGSLADKHISRARNLVRHRGLGYGRRGRD